MWKKRFRNSAVRIARSLGFLDDIQARKADKLIDCNPEDTSTDIFVGEGLLSESQAKVVAIKVAEQDPEKHLEETFKEAEKIQSDITHMGLDARELHAALAKKKASG